MESFTISNTKTFMSNLLKGNIFDGFEVRSVSVRTFVSYEIDCKLNKEFFDLDTQAEFEEAGRKYCMWTDIKPFVFEIIKGTQTPKDFKIVFSLPESICMDISEDAAALFVNIIYDGKEINCVTGCSAKNFSFDRTLDLIWDQYFSDFLYRKNIAFASK